MPWRREDELQEASARAFQNVERSELERQLIVFEELL